MRTTNAKVLLNSAFGVAVLAATGAVESVRAETGPQSILSGAGADNIDPTEVNPSKPIVLIVIQLSLIIALSRLLAFCFSKARQPRVVSEILAGILLGPTALGRIPGFTEHIFPKASITYLTLLSELGLVLFLFTVGMEADMGLLKRNFKPSLAVSLGGLAVPFGVGCAVSVGLFKQFAQPGVKFTTFMTFIGTSSSITALPVLARILGEIGLMNDRVGLVALAAGVVNDIIGWALLALSIALASAGRQVTVVFILLALTGWMLFLIFAIRPLLNYIARQTGSYGPNGPSQNWVCAALVMSLVSAFYCECIGISAILGGFLAGLIIPAEFAHPLTMKIEDVVSCILVPLYFATSGLSTNLTLLNSGIIWGWVFAVIVCAFGGKFGASTIAAKLCGFTWRESMATGSLMSAKGLIELIVLNQGLQAGIISETVFSIFVVEALTLTIAATPLTLLFYPARLRHTADVPPSSPTHSGDVKVFIDAPSSSALSSSDPKALFRTKTRYTVVLDQLESLGAAMVFTHLFASSGGKTETKERDIKSSEMSKTSTADGTTIGEPASGDAGLTKTTGPSSTDSTVAQTATVESSSAPLTRLTTPPGAFLIPQRLSLRTSFSTSASTISLSPLRLLEHTDRTSSSLLASLSPAQLLANDIVISLFRTFSSLLCSPGGGVGVKVENEEVRVEQQEKWAECIVRKAEREESDGGIVVGWKVGGVVAGGEGVGEESSISNPFSHLFPAASSARGSPQKRPSLPLHPTPSAASLSHLSANANTAPRFAAFLRSLFLEASTDVHVLVDRSSTPSAVTLPAGTGKTELFVPFFGGPDDRLAVETAVQLVLRSNRRIVAKILVVERTAEETEHDRAAFGGSATGVAEEVREEDEHGKNAEAYGFTSASQTHYGRTTGAGLTTSGGGELASDTADSILLAQLSTLIDSLSTSSTPPLTLTRVSTAFPLRTLVHNLPTSANSASSSSSPIILLGRSRRLAPSHLSESRTLLATAAKDGRLGGSVCRDREVRRALGEVGTAVLLGGEGGGEGSGWVWVVQSKCTGGGGGRRNSKREEEA